MADWVAGHFILSVHFLAVVVFIFWFFFGYQRFINPAASFLLSPYMLGEIGVFGFALLLSVTVLGGRWAYDVLGWGGFWGWPRPAP